MDIATLVIALVAAVLAGFTLLVATGQLRAARDSIGGHGLSVQWTTTEPPEDDDGVMRNRIVASVSVVGPGRRYNVAVRTDGLRVSSPLVIHPELHATSNPIVVELRATKEEMQTGWLVVTWVEPRGFGVTHQATRFSPDTHTQAQKWRWKRLMRTRVWWRRKKLPATDWTVGTRTEPLGYWDRDRDLRVLPGEGPNPMSDERREIPARTFNGDSEE